MINQKQKLKCLFGFHTWTYTIKHESENASYNIRECVQCHSQQARWVIQGLRPLCSNWSNVEDKYYSRGLLGK